jgi:hypothetical protein
MKNESISFPSIGTVVFHLGDNGDVTVLLDSIVLVGEFTTEDGPFGEDHLLSVWLNDRRTLEIPINSPGVTALLDQLSAKTGTLIKTSLVAESSFASRVLFPPESEGQELFVFQPARKGLVGWLYNNIMERRLVSDLVPLVETTPSPGSNAKVK